MSPGIVTSRGASAPRKYLDERRTVVNPEWLEWDDARRLRMSEDGMDVALSIGSEPSMYFPERDGKAIPEEGAWIIVVEEPHTELQARFRVPELSMWRARPHTLNSGAIKVGSGKDAFKAFPKQAVIATPGGDLHLWPHEYIVANDPMALATDPDSTLHALGGQAVLDEDQLFYLMSRGIPRREAVMLLFDRIESLDFVYVTFPTEITEALRGMGQSLRRHMANNPRGARP